MLVLSEFLQVLLVVSRLLLVDAVVSSLENSEFVEEVMLCEKKDTHLIFIKKLKWNCCDFFSNMYHKVAISDTSCLEANTGFFKLLTYEGYSKASIIHTGHWAVLAVHIMYCRAGISTSAFNRKFRVFLILMYCDIMTNLMSVRTPN